MTPARSMAAAAAALAWLVPCAPALAAEDLSPRIDHQAVAKATKGEPVEVRARIVGAGGRAIGEAAVLVKVEGIVGFTRVALKPVPEIPEIFFARIPAALAGAGFSYYLEAFDSEGNGPGRAGSAEAPFHVSMTSADLPVEPRVALPVAAPQPTLGVPAAAAPVILAQSPAAPRKRARSQLPTLGLFTLAGLGLGAGAIGQVGYQIYATNANEAFAGTSDGGNSRLMTGREYRMGETFGTLSVIGFVVGGAALVAGIVYAAWPDPVVEPPPAEKPPPADAPAPPPAKPAASPSEEELR